MVNKNVINEAKSNKSVPIPKKVVNKQAKSVCLSPFKIILKDKSKKSHAKQTPKKKKKSSEHPDNGKSPRRSSPRFKNTPEEPHNAEKTTQNNLEEPHDAEKTTPTRSSSRKTKSAVEPAAEKTTPTRSSPRKSKSSSEPEPEQSQSLQSTSGASQDAPCSEAVNKQKSAKQKLYSGPCPNVQLRNVNDTFSDLQDEEEDEDDEQEEK
ncbi:neurofilament medium polypeptide-like [Papaver somniferum]|uniref:neurofilament medium polypeptide-like n=1 Tax=Papaver somniferum TaxID=3469 RepID=UPI000E705BAA|nr:neurofilament medium polypeptide-like [Papaver somniferum]